MEGGPILRRLLARLKRSERTLLDFKQSADPLLQEIVGQSYLLCEKQGDTGYLARDMDGNVFRLRVDYHHGHEDETRARLGRYRLDLSHPNLAPYNDCGVNSSLSWRVGPHLSGPSLRELLKDGCAGTDLVRKFLLEGLSGLDALHSVGFVYENWSAENLVLHDERWVLDDVGWVPDIHRNVAGVWSDHPAIRDLYVMAPERLSGSTRTPNSDHYALGALSYLLLSGKPPFGESENLTETMLRILQQPPVPLAQIVPDVSADVAEAIEILLAKDPEERDVPAVLERLALKRTVRPPSSEFSRYLSGVREAGQAEDESGGFTLDPSQALSKLREFQFFEPHDFLIPLFASCLGSGATEVKIRARRGSFELSHSCSPFSGEELKLLFVAACTGGGTSLSNLGLAVTGALAAGARKVELSSGPHHLKLHQLEPPQVRTGRDRGFSFKFDGEMVGAVVPALLAQRLRFSPVPIHWNRTRLEVQEESLVTTRCLDGVEFTLETNLASEWPGLFLRVDGLSYGKPDGSLLPGVRMVLAGPWKTDLSFRGLVADTRQTTLIKEATGWLLQIATQDALEKPYLASRSTWYHALLDRLSTSDKEVAKIHLHIVKSTPYPSSKLDYLVERSCAYVYENRLEEWPKACRILALPAYLSSRPWPEMRSLALDAYGEENDHFWKFLLQAFLKFQNMEPSRDELRELLSRVHLIPEENRSLWDPSLQAILSKLIGQMPHPPMELRKEWLELLPAHDFLQTRSWLRP